MFNGVVALSESYQKAVDPGEGVVTKSATVAGLQNVCTASDILFTVTAVLGLSQPPND
jgi:hypothetical protein